jgi:hypothetical protein
VQHHARDTSSHNLLHYMQLASDRIAWDNLSPKQKEPHPYIVVHMRGAGPMALMLWLNG